MATCIEVIVSPTAEIQVSTKGFAGADCIAASKFLEQALGIVSDERKTTEFYQANQIQQHTQQ